VARQLVDTDIDHCRYSDEGEQKDQPFFHVLWGLCDFNTKIRHKLSINPRMSATILRVQQNEDFPLIRGGWPSILSSIRHSVAFDPFNLHFLLFLCLF